VLNPNPPRPRIIGRGAYLKGKDAESEEAHERANSSSLALYARAVDQSARENRRSSASRISRLSSPQLITTELLVIRASIRNVSHNFSTKLHRSDADEHLRKRSAFEIPKYVLRFFQRKNAPFHWVKAAVSYVRCGQARTAA
jgi:hypothetical protein